MAPFADINLMKLWTQSDQDSERKLVKVLQAMIDYRSLTYGEVSGKIKIGKELANPLTRWMEEEGHPEELTATLSTATLTISGNLMGNAVSADSCNKAVRVGTILQRQTDGMMCRVTVASFTSAPFNVTVAAHGYSSLSDNGDEATYDIVAEGWTDSREVDMTRSLDRKFRYVGTQIFAETFQILKTRKNTRYENVANEFEHQISKLVDKLEKKRAKSIVRGVPVISGGVPIYGDQVEESFMCGVLTWPEVTQAELANPSVYVNLSGADLTKKHLNDLVLNLQQDELANFNSGNWAFVCHPKVYQYVQDVDISYRRMTQDAKGVGFSVEEFHSKIGKTIPFISDRIMRPGDVGLVNFDKFEYGYYANDRLDRKEIPTKGRFEQWLISFQCYGVVARDPRANVAKIYNARYA